MMKFIDGPAAGQTLAIRRAPILLRVVRENGKWDALDQLEDSPRPGEEVFVYILADKPQRVHLYRQNGSGWYWFGEYRMLSEQPADSVLRDNARWSQWCDANKDRLMPEWARG